MNFHKNMDRDFKNKTVSNAENFNMIEKAEKFDEMNLKKEIIRGIFDYGFEKPSVIQQRGIIPLTKKKDVIAQAQSGTGKTATFVIGTLQNLIIEKNQIQVLITVPTRELADQIKQVFASIGAYMPIEIQLCIGGTPVFYDISVLRKKIPHIIIGTPGRLIDILSSEKKLLSELKYLIIDEADEMFSKGFKIQIFKIFKFIPKYSSVALFSATLPKDVLETIELFMKDPVKILVKKDELTLEGIRQFFVAVEIEEWKLDTLRNIYRTIKVTQTIIYVNTRRKVEWLAQQMKISNFNIASIHGDMSQEDRNRIMKEFRSGLYRVLIATDLIARGIDIQQVSLVINYDIPTNKESYIHRIGRSGRFGRKGIAINFLGRTEVPILREIEAYYNTVIDEMPNDISEFF